MKVMCIDDEGYKNYVINVIPFGKIVTVARQCSLYEQCWEIKEYPKDKLGRPCAYHKFRFTPLSDIDEKELLEQRQQQLQTA